MVSITSEASRSSHSHHHGHARSKSADFRTFEFVPADADADAGAFKTPNRPTYKSYSRFADISLGEQFTFFFNMCGTAPKKSILPIFNGFFQ